MISSIVKLYENHSVACTGMKGSGKDLLTANVVVRRIVPYSCNIDYTHDERYIPLKFEDLNCRNDRRNFVSGKINKFVSPYPEGTDVYISDAGIYLPAQYCNELNKEYPYLPVYMAISRHLNNGRVHYNCQNLNRVYDKVREMCSRYIYCHWAKVFFGKIVIQRVTIYDKASSCQDRVQTPRITLPFRLIQDSSAIAQKNIYLDKFRNTYGLTRSRLLIYINKANYDTRHFKKLLEEGDE